MANQNRSNSSNNTLVPISILIGSVVIGGAVIFSGNSGSAVTAQLQPLPPPPPTAQAPRVPQASDILLSEVTDQDHIRGSLDAAVKIVEFSDFECPFCKRVHPTLQKIVDEYGPDQVAWVYRHLPLDALHPIKARKEAVASECAAEQGGNDMFWAFADTLFDRTLSNNRTDMAILPEIAADIGLNVDEFNTCLESGKFDQHIEDNVQDAFLAGGSGTPYSVVVAPNGKKFPLSGAQPYAAFKAVVDLALKEK